DDTLLGMAFSDTEIDLLAQSLDKRLPPVGDGPEPTGGQRALANSANVTGRFLSTLSAPRKRADRSIGDEFAILVAQGNQGVGGLVKGNRPIDIADPGWSKIDPIVHSMLARLALGRWNAYQCAAGRGHCPQPSVLEVVGNAISKIPVLGPVLK